MNKIIFILCIYWPIIGWAQLNNSSETNKYIVLSNKNLNTHHIVAERTGANYIGINSTSVEIFNILYPQSSIAVDPKNKNYPTGNNIDTVLVSISVLPIENRNINWINIRLDSIPKNQILSYPQLAKEANTKLTNFFRAGKPLDRTLLTSNTVIPIIELNKKFYIPDAYVLTNVFLIKPAIIHRYEQADMATINTKSPVFSTSSLLKSASQHNNNPHTQLWASVFAGNLLQGKNHGRYEFWSNARPLSHASLLYYGLDKFLYQTGIGIVSGKYEAYFSSKRQFIDDFFDIVSIDNKHPEFR